MVAISMMSAKLATLALLKIKELYDIITFFHDFTNKILSRNSNYVVDVVM